MKSKGVAYLLHIFLGWLGAGRFYVGDIGMGILNLLTIGGFGFLWVIDLFLLSGRVDYKNAMFMARQASAQASSTNVNNNNVNVTIDATALQNLQAAAAANPTVAQPQAVPVEQPKEEVNLTKPRF
ncbi:TM2 domain-containing protein [Bacillus sp. 3103sda1]|uniref:TM2 domain-containing protein n=1 Tax=Bacillus sp. 3103sda1 TaxID=2953808 RepID=UPI00209D0C1D|nr:TM2 domain-containing protein [Bacillus sp. 3103sda1]MCP1122599.1 TM2 domain-containing protein [Bacillus sp. 3103sda1]